MKKPLCRPVSLKNALNGKRIRLNMLTPGAAIVPACAFMPILGCWFRQVGTQSRLTVYVNGTMPLALRTAAELHRTEEETWLAEQPDGIREIDVTDCRGEYLFQLPTAESLAA
jgi:hypothetical protein